MPLAEDRALADRLIAHDLKLRRSLAPLVYTSARTDGRAPGGFADMIRGFADRRAPCDAALEPVAMFVRRTCWRARLRAVHAREGERAALVAAAPLLDGAGDCGSSAGFGAFWAEIERVSQRLRRQRLYPEQLARELRLAQLWLRRIRQGADSRADIPLRAIA